VITPASIDFPALLQGEGDGPLRADFNTSAAPLALNIPNHEVRKKILRFRVGAPQTMQRAAFHKDRGSDPRAVVDTESLDIKNESLFFIRLMA
jgi:hypothetical protein